MKVLVIKPSSLGDIIHALPFLNALKGTFPDASVDWIISKNLKGILEENPLINELIIFSKDDWKNLKTLPRTMSDISLLRKKLQSQHYDIVVDLQGLLRSGLIAFLTPTPLKIGFEDAREGSRYFYDRKISANKSLHAVDKCLEIAKEIGAKIKSVHFPLHVSTTAKTRVKELLGDISEYVVIVPSARWITKRWPAEHFASLINKMTIPCVITGGKGDRVIAKNIISLSSKGSAPPAGSTLKKRVIKAAEEQFSNNIINLCGKTDLKELTALIAGAKAVVSNDSGPMHIAAALDIPTVAIFGPTDPVKTGPYGWQTNKKLNVLKADVPCSPCRKKKCNTFICTSQVTVGTVYDALRPYV
jgi:lipopolysaccharide heptosyltransferase I